MDPRSCPAESEVLATRTVGPVLALSASTAMCALIAVLTVNWDGCATEVGVAAPIALVLATVVAIFSIYFIVTQAERPKRWLRRLSIALVSSAVVTTVLTLLGISASNSGCS